eukprot:COSAG01_NODE_3427_length_6093_cov_9.704943_1_plen_68_part_00
MYNRCVTRTSDQQHPHVSEMVRLVHEDARCLDPPFYLQIRMSLCVCIMALGMFIFRMYELLARLIYE